MAKIDFNNIDEKTKGYIKIGIIILGLFIGLFLIFFIIKLVVGSVVPFEKIENIMVRAADQYMEKHEDKFNKNEPYETIELNVSDLVAEEYMDDFSKYTAKDVMCNGKVLVVRNDENVSYIPKLDCGDAYKYKNLVDEIIKEENIVTFDSGLYKVESDTSYYVYRGEYPNNYVSYAGKIWRILRIDENNNIRMIQEDYEKNLAWDDRYNLDKKMNIGINDFESTQPSRLKDELVSLYNNDDLLLKKDKSLIVPHEICIGKRSEAEFNNTGSVECSKKSELMGVGSIYLSEFIQASLDPNCIGAHSNSCSNYNYLAKLKKKFFTVTASSDNSYEIFLVNGSAYTAKANNYAYVRMVANINSNINYESGSGTQDDPYIIKANVIE